MTPHPQSRAALLLLNEQLRQEALSRARALRELPLKREFERVRLKHQVRKFDKSPFRSLDA